MSRRKLKNRTGRPKPNYAILEVATPVEAFEIESESAIFPGETYKFPDGQVGPRQLGLPAPLDRPDLDDDDPAVLFARFMAIRHQGDGNGVPEYIGIIGEAYLYARQHLAERRHKRSDDGAHWGITIDCHPELDDPGRGPLSCLDAYQAVEAFENLLFHYLMKEPKPGQATDISTDELRDILDLAAKVGLFAGRVQARGAERFAKTGMKMSKIGKKSSEDLNKARSKKSNEAAREYIRSIRDVDKSDWVGIRKRLASRYAINYRTIDKALKRLASEQAGEDVTNLLDATKLLLEHSE